MKPRESAPANLDLFDLPSEIEPRQESLGPGAAVLRGFATADAPVLLAALQDVIGLAPFRHMVTPGGFRMSVAMGAPIVSVSLGIPAIFLFGGSKRSDRAARVPLAHGDVVVWGGPARLRYHGVLPLPAGYHPLVGGCRINLTFRRAA